MSQVAELRYDGKIVEIPLVEGTEEERAIDIRELRNRTGLITLDPGYGNTGSCESAVTYIDGEAGILRYRGYPIEQLAEHSSFLEVSYLLVHGELPGREQLHEFTESIRYHTMLHEDFSRFFFSALPKDAHPMAACAAAVGGLATFYPDSLDPRDLHEVKISIHRLIAKFPTIAAHSYKHSVGQPSMYPDNRRNYVGNLLHMMFATPCEEYEVDPVVRKAIDMLLILHADHEQNCSTSTVRLVGSSMVNLFGAIAAGIGALWGPRHGGANQQVIEMLEQIAEEGLSAREFVDRAKSRDDTSRLMGFGHRVYKNYDPRAKIIRKSAHDVLHRLGVQSKLLEIAMDLEELALKDEYFTERRLYPNVDFYSGVIYKAIGTPVNMFTVMFALGRLPGWIAQWLEMHEDKQRIGRPRQIYVGANERSYLPLEER